MHPLFPDNLQFEKIKRDVIAEIALDRSLRTRIPLGRHGSLPREECGNMAAIPRSSRDLFLATNTNPLLNKEPGNAGRGVVLMAPGDGAGADRTVGLRRVGRPHLVSIRSCLGIGCTAVLTIPRMRGLRTNHTRCALFRSHAQ